MLVPIDRLQPGPNIRKVMPPAAQQRDFEESVRSNGVLQSLLCRPLAGPERYEVVLGQRRYLAAVKVGLLEVPIESRELSNEEARLLQLVENIQRETMHPTDTWRAVRELMRDGLELDEASRRLGLGERHVRRMELLGRLNATLLHYCEIEMPSDTHLRMIANATAKIQSGIVKGRNLLHDSDTRVSWHIAAQACIITRIPRARALFDPEAIKGLHWDEDFFVPPGDEDQFTTTDTERFLTAQRTALIELIKGRPRCSLALMKDGSNEPVLPRRASIRSVMPLDLDKLPRLKKTESACFALKGDGRVSVYVMEEAVAKKKAPAKQADAEREEGATSGGTSGVPFADPEDDEDETENGARGPVTHAGHGLIAAAKREAFRQAIETAIDKETVTTETVLSLLVVALCADNVTVRQAGYHEADFKDLARELMEPGGNLLKLTPASIASIGLSAIERIVQFNDPHASGAVVSGHPGESVAHILNAETHMGRFDTEAFLKTASAPLLRKLARDIDLSGTFKTMSGLRAALKDKAPDWRPPGASFGAWAQREKESPTSEREAA